jgi:hypothetical protein
VSVRPSEGRLWPFLSYPMYSRSHSPDKTVRMRELRVRTCGAGSRVWKVEPSTIGYQAGYRYTGELGAIARGRPNARRYRATMSHLAGTHVEPRPCALQLWERAVTMTRDGVDPAALRTPRWVPLLEWLVDDPDSVRVLTP